MAGLMSLCMIRCSCIYLIASQIFINKKRKQHQQTTATKTTTSERARAYIGARGGSRGEKERKKKWINGKGIFKVLLGTANYTVEGLYLNFGFGSPRLRDIIYVLYNLKPYIDTRIYLKLFRRLKKNKQKT